MVQTRVCPSLRTLIEKRPWQAALVSPSSLAHKRGQLGQQAGVREVGVGKVPGLPPFVRFRYQHMLAAGALDHRRHPRFPTRAHKHRALTAPLAQWLERWSSEPSVAAGSSPVWSKPVQQLPRAFTTWRRVTSRGQTQHAKLAAMCARMRVHPPHDRMKTNVKRCQPGSATVDINPGAKGARD